MLNMGRFIPADWFPYLAAPEMELLELFVVEVESVAKKMVQDFKSGDEDEYYDVGDPEQPQPVCVYKGLGDDGWCLSEVFEGYLPSLHRASGLLTFYGVSERMLRSFVCKTVRYFDDSYLACKQCRNVDSSVKYIRSKYNVNTVLDSCLRDIGLVRHSFAHCAGRTELIGIKRNRILCEHVDKNQFLRFEKDEIVVLDGYLTFVFKQFNEYYELIHKAAKVHTDDHGVNI